MAQDRPKSNWAFDCQTRHTTKSQNQKKKNSGDQIKENVDFEQLRVITLRIINAMRLGYD